ncbi:MAG: T9SS type A sorting domain-containing protein [Flammeovirgaceae bacterium]|nr:MAG: T9SS type A sorting domain-containing protein [Flammeovirgaceae bacterium]
MSFNKIILLTTAFCVSILGVIYFNPLNNAAGVSVNNKETAEDHVDAPEQFILFHRGIRTRESQDKPGYQQGYKIKELLKAKTEAARKKAGRQQSNGVLAWTERGPANVPGRTRGLIVDPIDPQRNTWYAGSVAGGIWRTTNAGQSWTLLTPDLPNLATTVIAMAESNNNIMYCGTGEGFGNVDGVNGNGIFKSTDRGITWTYLPSTAGFNDVNRLIIDPADADVVIVATNNGIYRTTNGGTSWTQTSTLSFIQDLKATPGNFNIQYATRNGFGVLKSTDGGQTWSASNTGMNITGRVEIAVSPVNPNRIFASTEGSLSGTNSDLYMSDNGGTSWSLVDVTFNGTGVNFLGGQGWYDNTIACDPFNANIVYYGGVNLFRTQLTGGSTSVGSYSLQQNATQSFMELVTFTGASNGNFQVGPQANSISVELRFGPGKSQKAHRFLVPEGATSGVPEANYSYTDYVDVPFEVWDITNNRQLMVSFRDQGRDGQFNLINFNTDGTALQQSREYVYVNNVTYNASAPSPSIAVNGGQVFNMMYNIWPYLAEGKSWPGDVVESQLRFLFTSVPKLNASTITVSDAYNQFDGKNRFQTFGVDMHPDQHNIVIIPMSGSTYKILVANDGGLFVSNTSSSPGIAQGNWTMAGNTYNTSQFYGADKRPGKDEYFGGMQDNGTWKSPANTVASATTNYVFNLGGDGFEVLWHSLDDQKLIGGSQFNNFSRSTNGGNSWTPATSGITGTSPFISKLANSKLNPETIFTVTSSGVFRSTNFGTSWTLTPITEKWGASTFLDVEVSQANANIVWAGSGMSATRNLHVSTNGGLSFTLTNNFTDVTLGTISKLASHPFEPNTAYALFSFADAPKVLRTTDLGQTWQDISGFGNNAESSTGFPDVAVYCLYVRPDNPNIIWVGSEIGIIESLDNGQTWALIDEFPKVSVWDMKGQDDQVVIATHGRGIWTATIDALQTPFKKPEVVASGTSPQEDLKLKVKVEENFDSVQVFAGATKIGSLPATVPSEIVLSVSDLTPGNKDLKLIGFKGNGPVHSITYPLNHLDILSLEDTYSTYFKTTSDLTVTGLSLQTTPGGNNNERSNLQTQHSYVNNFEYQLIIRHPVKVNAASPLLHYRDIAIVEPVNDYVVVEATTNGLDWIALAPAYDAAHDPAWLSAYTAGQPGNKSMFVDHVIDLTETFNDGDEVLIRFRIKTSPTTNAWGWAIDFVNIQMAPTGIENPETVVQQFSLYPNPANDFITAAFELKQRSYVNLKVIDPTGKLLTQQNLGQKPAGKHEQSLELGNRPDGVYFFLLQTSGGTSSSKFVIKK